MVSVQERLTLVSREFGVTETKFGILEIKFGFV